MTHLPGREAVVRLRAPRPRHLGRPQHGFELHLVERAHAAAASRVFLSLLTLDWPDRRLLSLLAIGLA